MKLITGRTEDLETFKEGPILSFQDSPMESLGKNKDLYWFPIDEIDHWGYTPFYWANRVLNSFLKRDVVPETVLIACHAGINRSRTMAYVLSMSMNLEIEQGHLDYRKYQSNVKEYKVPEDIFKFMGICQKKKQYSLMSVKHILEGKYELTDGLD